MKYAGREAEYQKEYREANRAHLKAVAAARYAANPGPALARAKKRAAENHEEYLRYQREYRAAHRVSRPRRSARTPEQVRESKRLWAAQHPEQGKAWRAANPERYGASHRMAQNRRRVRKVGGGGLHTAVQWRALCEAWEWSCTYCGYPVTERSVHRDHRVPISRGGSDDISNIAVACARCNLRKHALTDVEFFARLAKAA